MKEIYVKGREIKGNEKSIDNNDDRCALRHKVTETDMKEKKEKNEKKLKYTRHNSHNKSDENFFRSS